MNTKIILTKYISGKFIDSISLAESSADKENSSGNIQQCEFAQFYKRMQWSYLQVNEIIADDYTHAYMRVTHHNMKDKSWDFICVFLLPREMREVYFTVAHFDFLR